MEYNAKDMSLEELVRRAKRKDDASFTILIHKIENEMYSLAKMRLYENEDIYEAMQNSIILIYKNIKKLKDEKLFRTCAMRILINESLKIIKKKKIDLEKYTTFDEKTSVSDYRIDEIESRKNLECLLKCLNESEKVVITLYYGKKYTTKDIAEILAESEGTIKSRMSRARLKLKKYIEEEHLYE